MSQWADFYRTRDPERYLRYARARYAPFLAIVQAAIRPGDTVIELGCGMGTVTPMTEAEARRKLFGPKVDAELARVFLNEVALDMTRPH